MATEQDRIECKECGAKIHSVEIHIKDKHPGMTVAEYQAAHPGAPILSEYAKQMVAEAKAKKEAAAAPTTKMAGVPGKQEAFHVLFGLDPKKKGVLAASGRPIMLNIIDPGSYADMVPAIDPDHVFDLDLLKNICMGLEMGMNVYSWGHAGTGKTTTFFQVAARTGRPTLRIQHSIGTEESHIIGQYVVKGGATVWQPGPLSEAMKYGWLYIADEYDFALPAVLSVYQPVLEGQPLVAKDAPPEWRVVKPHPNFRIVATGNTNGSGDETGLYQGTQIQNAANYERFGIVIRVHYMEKAKEIEMIVKKTKVSETDAEKLVGFATAVREAYDNHKISATVSPRSLVNAALIGQRRASFRAGLALSFTNRLNKVDREAVDGIAQRIFGSTD